MAHIHEKIDFTASIYIVFENKVLLHVHKKLGMWLPPGGHIELDEDPNQAALREAKEETALDVKLAGDSLGGRAESGGIDLIPPRFVNRHFFDVAHTHEHVDLVYFARSDNDRVVMEEGASGYKWFTKEDLESNTEGLLDKIRLYALAALKELAS